MKDHLYSTSDLLEGYDELLDTFIQNPKVDDSNFDLAIWYHDTGHTAAAISFYIRTAERTSDRLLQYECLLRASMCFNAQGSRGNSVKGLLQHAVALFPERPEAYFFLSRYYEQEGEWFDSYTLASIGVNTSDDHPQLRTDVGYPGKFGTIFEKAVSAWWCGLCDESIKLLKELITEHPLDKLHRDAVENNLRRLNVWDDSYSDKKNLGELRTPETFSSNMKTIDDEIRNMDRDLTVYKKETGTKLKVTFPKSNKIERNYSEAFQDIFVLLATNGKRNGTFVEVGTGYSVYGNNTYLLEKEFDWNGISLDVVEEFVDRYNHNRTSKGLLKDATTVDYSELFKTSGLPENIDYLQLDCEPPSITYKALENIPFDEYKFAVITYEHDYYSDSDKIYRTLSRELLTNNGYKLIVGNVSPREGVIFEDWWVHPDLVNIDRLKDITKTELDEVVANSLFLEKSNNTPNWKSTEYPTLEITTTIPKNGCAVDCAFCPQRVLIQSYKGKKSLTFDEFKTVIDKLPREIRITFAGFTEPWLHKECTDMLLYAHSQGHKITVFTTGIGMNPEDVIRLKDIPYAGDPNGGFVLHLPDQEMIAKHPITEKYLKVLDKFAEHAGSIQNFRLMSMGELHEKVRDIFPQPGESAMWSRAGNLNREVILKPELLNLTDRFRSIYHGPEPHTCGCEEKLYHNVLLPNGDVSLCCMDYGLEQILGNLFESEYDDIMPKPLSCFDLCNYCENAVKPELIENIPILG